MTVSYVDAPGGWTVDVKTAEKGPWENLGTVHDLPDDAWNYLTYLRRSGLIAYHTACVRPA